MDSFRYEEAAELCLQAVEREPDSVTVLEEVGPLLLELGHVDHAQKVWSAVYIDPSRTHNYF